MPLLGEGSTGQLVEHALVKLLRDREAHVARLGNILRQKRMGRPPTAVVQSRIGAPPSMGKLRQLSTAPSRREASRAG